MTLGNPAFSQGVVAYRNEFYNVGDDAIEADGPCYNLAIWENHFNSTFSAISLAPHAVGPTWVLRNRLYMTHRQMPDGSTDNRGPYEFPDCNLKFEVGADGGGTGTTLVYHNSCHVSSQSIGKSAVFMSGSGIPGLIVHSRNNSWTANPGAVCFWGGVVRQPNIVTTDYDHYWDNADYFFGKESVKYYTSFSEFQTDGYDVNGVWEAPQFGDVTIGDFSVPQASALVDGGLVIPGINDHWYAGSAPDIGAVERDWVGVSHESKVLPLFARAYPNPFRTQVRIPVPSSAQGPLKLRVFDGRGRAIAAFTLGSHNIESIGTKTAAFAWDGRDADGRAVSSGLYVYRLTASVQEQWGKVYVVR